MKDQFIKKFMSAEAEDSMYGYQTDEVKTNPFNFGLNAGNCFLTKFTWIPNGGKDGAEQEALDIVFTINGTPKNYRLFPVTKVFGKNNEEITDTKSPEFKEAITDFNARITHILHAFMDKDTIQAKLSRPFKSFKDYAQFVEGMLPAGYNEVPLDIFLQYSWTIREGQSRSYLEIPAKMKYGAWLRKATGPQDMWEEHKVANPTEAVKKALWYVSKKDASEHPFFKNGWFMASNFANQQRTGDANTGGYQGSAPVQDVAAAPVAGTAAAPAGKGSAW